MLWRLVGRCELTLGLVACCGGVAFHQPVQPAVHQRVQAVPQAKISRTAAQQKLDSHIYLAGQVARGVVDSGTLPSLPEFLRLLEFDEKGNVHVDIQSTVTPELLSAIIALGGAVESSFPNYGAIRAWISPAAAETLAVRPDVTFIKPAALATTNTRPGGTE